MNCNILKEIEPGDDQTIENLPGYLLLARLEKRVLRPGGIELTKKMLEALNITSADRVVEYAPGIGVTAAMALRSKPAGYLAIEKDPDFARLLKDGLLAGHPGWRCIQADAAEPLPVADDSVTAVYGESMLTIHPPQIKDRIMRQVSRMLSAGGRYAMQEISLIPDELSPERSLSILSDVRRAVRHPAWPNTVGQWRSFLDRHGFEIVEEFQRPVLLLEPDRMLEDEGAEHAFRFSWNVLENDAALGRVREIRSVFKRHRKNLCGYCAVCRKKELR
jgi:phospholipid N-methyltransferase